MSDERGSIPRYDTNLFRKAKQMTENERLQQQTEALTAAVMRRIEEAKAMPGLGDIRADRSIPIRSRKHSVSHKALR